MKKRGHQEPFQRINMPLYKLSETSLTIFTLAYNIFNHVRVHKPAISGLGSHKHADKVEFQIILTNIMMGIIKTHVTQVLYQR